MASPLEREIRAHVDQYLAGEISLGELDDWLWPATADIEQIDDQVSRDLTNEIILRLAEYSHGDWTEAELKDLLRPIAAPTATGVAPS